MSPSHAVSPTFVVSTSSRGGAAAAGLGTMGAGVCPAWLVLARPRTIGPATGQASGPGPAARGAGRCPARRGPTGPGSSRPVLGGGGVSVIGAAINLGLVVVALIKMKVARPVVVIVCVLFGLVLGATPIGDRLYTATASVGIWLSDAVTAL